MKPTPTGSSPKPARCSSTTSTRTTSAPWPPVPRSCDSRRRTTTAKSTGPIAATVRSIQRAICGDSCNACGAPAIAPHDMNAARWALSQRLSGGPACL